jgi:hypothetical protein
MGISRYIAFISTLLGKNITQTGFFEKKVRF